jgi:hypothetical protein
MQETDWRLAEAVARDLVNRETDINELQKVVSFARIQTTMPGARVGEKFFALLDAMARDGRYLVRSGRTLDYYRDLQAVCREHLSGYRTAGGEEGKKLVEILGWTARLMRYYNTDAGDDELIERQRAVGSKPSSSLPLETASASFRAPIPTINDLIERQTKAPGPPKHEIKRETVTLITSAKNGKAQARTDKGEEISCSNLPSYPPAKAGDVCRADVTRENGKAIKCVFKART